MRSSILRSGQGRREVEIRSERGGGEGREEREIEERGREKERISGDEKAPAGEKEEERERRMIRVR